MLALEKLLTGCGVRILYDTRVCAVDLRKSRIDHVIVENKSGRSALTCRAVVDATGDADVCFLAGEQTESLDSNVLGGWYYLLGPDGLKFGAAVKRFDPCGGREDADGPFFRGDDAEHVTAQILGTRELIRRRLEEMRAGDAEADIQIISPPTIASFRMTRRLVGAFSLGERHVHEWFADTVAMTGDWRKSGPVYAIPLRCLCGGTTRNLLTAGRCISADRTAWDVTRAIPTCAATGEAAGTAAAMAACRREADVSAVPIDELQSQLRRQGVLLEAALVRPAKAQGSSEERGALPL
jgi:hypothetical protein